VSEDGLVKYMVEKGEKSEKDIRSLKIADVMEPPPPIVDVSTPAKAMVQLVRFSKCVLVSEKGDIVGIITVADTLKMVE
jgi:predicted transcriptional regulator